MQELLFAVQVFTFSCAVILTLRETFLAYPDCSVSVSYCAWDYFFMLFCWALIPDRIDLKAWLDNTRPSFPFPSSSYISGE